MSSLATIAHQFSRRTKSISRVCASGIGNVLSGATVLTCASNGDEEGV